MTTPQIVLIDDDADSRDGITDYLKDVAHYSVRSFGNGRGALAFLEDEWQQCSVVLLDLALTPSMPGDEVLREVRTRYPRLPVIVYSGRDPQGTIQTLAQGAYAIMQGPLDLVEMEKIIRGVFESDAAFMQMASDIRSLLGFDVGIAWRIDRQAHLFRIAGWSGDLDDAYRSKMTLKAADPIWQRFLRHGEPILVPDLTDTKRMPNFRYREEVIERGWRSLITVPLVYRGRILSLVDCYSRELFEFTDEEHRNQVIHTLHMFANQAVAAVRHAELLLQSRALQELNQTLANTLEEDAILQSILSKAIELVGADFGWLYLLDANTSELRLRGAVGIPTESLDSVRKLGEGVTGWVAQHGVLHSDSDLTQMKDQARSPMHKPTRQITVLSEVAVPLRRGSRTIGVLTVKSRYADYFTSDHKDLLVSLAAMAAVAIERTKLTVHLHEVSRLALTVVNFQDLAGYVTNAVRDLTGADVALWMLSSREDEGDHYLRIEAAKGNIDDNYIKTTRLSTRPGESIAAQALLEHRVIIRRDIADETDLPRFQYLPEAQEQGWQSCMVVPLLGRGDISLGVLGLYSNEIGKFDASDGQLMQTFANQSSIAFQQQRWASALHRLAEVGKSLAVGITEAKDLLARIARIGSEIVGADCAVIYPYDPSRHLYYQQEAVASFGLRHPHKEVTSKPRKQGLTALVRKYRVIVVDDVNSGNVRTQFELVRPPETLNTEICDRIHESNFINREQIRAFVSVSLLAHAEREDSDLLEVGTLYVNFRAPHYFSQEELQVIHIYADQVANVIRGARLLSDAQQKTAELETLHESAMKILERQEVVARMHEIVEAATSLLRGTGGKLFLYDEERRKLWLAASKSIDPILMPLGYEINMNEGMAGKVFASKKPMLVKNYSLWEGRVEKLATAFRSMIEYPLLLKDDAIGVLAVFDSIDEGRFSESDYPILDRLARQAALAIHNAQIDEEMQERIDQLNALYETSLAITSQVDLPDSAGRILDELGRFIRYDKATVQLIENGRRHLAAYRGFSEDQIDTNTLLRPVSADSLIQRVIDGRSPLVLSDTSSDEDWVENATTRNVHSWVCVPLYLGDQAIGLMTLDHSQPGFYQRISKGVLALFANLAAIAIQKAGLVRDLKGRVADLEFVDAVVQIIGGKLETPEILYSVVQQIGERFDCSQCTLFLPYRKDGGILLKAEVAFPPTANPGNIHAFEPGLGLAGWVYEHDRSVCLPDARSDPRFIAIRDSAKQTPRAMLLAPVKAGDSVIGVISADRDTPNWFDANHERLLNALASHVAIALERAKLFRDFDEARRQYVQDVAHQLIGPLSGLRAHASNLEIGFMSADGRSDVLKAIIAVAGMVQRYAENFNYAARTELSMFRPSEYKPHILESESLIHLLNECADAYRQLAVAKGLQGIEIDFESFHAFPSLKLDEDMFSFMILNLYDNAVKYSYRGSPIVTAGQVYSDHVEISVVSHGIPLNDEDAQQLFQRNFRSRSAQDAAISGTGIGLYVSKQIAILHGGNIHVVPSQRSEYGNEVKFIISLPLV
jgi:GAF domain-containing protein